MRERSPALRRAPFSLALPARLCPESRINHRSARAGEIRPLVFVCCKAMNASIIAIGSEMLGPTRVDTNSLKITAALEDFGVACARKSVVGDRLRDLADEIRYCAERTDIVVTTGGLGPTEDDLTREA